MKILKNSGISATKVKKCRLWKTQLKKLAALFSKTKHVHFCTRVLILNPNKDLFLGRSDDNIKAVNLLGKFCR